MGRRLQVNSCMLCGSTPCTCGTKSKPQKAPVIKAVKTEQPVQKPAITAPKALVRKPPPAPVKTERKLVVETTDQDKDLHRALCVLATAGLMGADDREKYAIIIASGIPVTDRAAAWRARREASQ